jgi:hypothetical protein
MGVGCTGCSVGGRVPAPVRLCRTRRKRPSPQEPPRGGLRPRRVGSQSAKQSRAHGRGQAGASRSSRGTGMEHTRSSMGSGVPHSVRLRRTRRARIGPAQTRRGRVQARRVGSQSASDSRADQCGASGAFRSSPGVGMGRTRHSMGRRVPAPARIRGARRARACSLRTRRGWLQARAVDQ